ncbi:UNC93-like protein MFSD11 isoform X1 [Aphis gossypii]|uniref:UNC93-like protein MFSD11 isoform X1 n=1 Tax=Aphis gossypii TaxID=80765 RepID=UPI002159066D|nr:UNC93-like protein MFSD11 isoform X1 [Aphis gossypii]XP_027852590.2 UNC93-like protein MFSD11 isoform X1 [Aphis gossypii]XP_027852592.2 UNC93-like protein MFSD11 isoform X1 [Aphis gossypii]XP_050053535.1 UNC93-like protein MFSD11 isoform X1 [Aphis gossypii]
MDRRLMNISILGLGFMFVFTSFLTVSNIEKTVLKSIEKEDPSFTGDGYTSLCIIYGVFALCNWLAPTIIGMIGSRKSIYLGSICYVAFLTPFLWPSNILLYTMSVLLGFGASIIWTGQGTYLTMNSDLSTISRNSGIFWAMSKISICIGNVFVILVLRDKTELNESTRMLVFTVLAVVCGFGTLILMILRPSVDAEDKENEVNFQKPNSMIPKKELKDSMRLLMTKDMLLLSTLFLFTGLHVSFYSGVYSSCIAFTKSMSTNTNQLLGYTGILVGVGEVTGGLLCSILGKKSPRSDSKFSGLSRSTVIIISFLINIVAYGLIFVNLPNDSPFGDSYTKSFIKPNQYLAVFCGFLLGLGDSGFTTQIYNIIGVKYSDNSSSATSLFMFMQAMSAAISFFYSNQFGIYAQLIILIIVMTIGTLSFLVVDKFISI